MQTAETIRWLAATYPREAVQAAAMRGLAADAVSSPDLHHFNHVAGLIENLAETTDFGGVFDAAVEALVAVARTSGRAQREAALAAVVRLGSAVRPERRVRAVAALGTLRQEYEFRQEPDPLERAISRLNVPPRL